MSRGSSGFSLVVTSGSMNVAETYGNIGFNQYLDQAIKHQAWYLNAYRCWISINLILMGFPGNILKRIILLGYINHPSIFHAAIKVKTIYDAFFIHSRDGTISRKRNYIVLSFFWHHRCKVICCRHCGFHESNYHIWQSSYRVWQCLIKALNQYFKTAKICQQKELNAFSF